MSNSDALKPSFVVDLSNHFKTPGEIGPRGVGWDGTILAVTRSSSESLRATQPNGVSFAKSRFLEGTTNYTVVAWRDGHTTETTIRNESMVANYIQPTPQGFLLVGARCNWSSQRVEQNAAMYDWSGQLQARMTLGDGIRDVRVAPNGLIWVSYFDEGVFGNYGWGGPGPTPLGAAGLCAFDLSGQLVFEYDPSKANTGQICDVYALNINTQGEILIYFYTEFPIVRIRNGFYQKWNFGQGGAFVLAIHDPYVVLLGSYKNPLLARIVELASNGSTRELEEKFLIPQEGQLFPETPSTAVFGVGSRLYLFNGYQCVVFDDWWPGAS